MIRGRFLKAEERAHLEALVRHPAERHGVARRANALLLLDDGWSCERAAEALYLDDDTVRGWHGRYVAAGTASLSEFGWKGGATRLSADEEAQLASALSARLHISTGEIMAFVEKAFDARFSKAGIIKLLHRLGFEYRKPKGLPAKACEAAQEAFIRHYESLLNGLLPDETVFFADAVHPEYQSRPAHGWIRRGDRLAVKRGKGRARMNLMGALCLETGGLELVETLKMTTATTIELLSKLERHTPGKGRIHVILDRAPVHRGSLVAE